MKASIALLLVLLGTPLAAADRTAWYREAKFGMFIHWGPYSQASVEASWPIMRPARDGGITESAYRALPKTFNPVRFDPAAWVKLAKAAGQRYMVFTTKHHDGFCMFDSAYTKYKITNTPYAKDAVAMLAKACHDEKMPIGFYYSPPDLDHPGYRDTSKPSAGNWRGEPWRAEWPLYLDYMEMQLRELLTRYGDVALIWFDGLNNQEKYDGHRMHRVIREMQPDTLVNNRVGLPGDYETPEQFVPKVVPAKGVRISGTTPVDMPKKTVAAADFRLFEVCMTINNTWGYNRNDTKFKSTEHLIRTLIDVASKGGNFLLNVGPTPEGTIQPEFVERLTAMGKWLEVNGESIYGTTFGPLQDLPFGRSTAKGKTVYLHVFDWQAPKLEVRGLAGRVAGARLLAGGKALTFRQTGDVVTIDTPAQAPDVHASVVALRMK